MKIHTAALLLSAFYLLNVNAATSPPFLAHAHHEQTFLERRASSPPYQAHAHHEQTFERRAIVPQSHADMFTAHQSLERRDYSPVPVGVAPEKDLQRRDYSPVPVGVAPEKDLQRRELFPVSVGLAKTAPVLDRRGYLSTHVAAHREPTIYTLERRANNRKKRVVKKRVVRKKPVKRRIVKKKPVKKHIVKKRPKTKTNLSKCIEELRHGYPAYDNMREATDLYHHVLSMFPEQLISDDQKAKEISNEITLGLQSARTYLTIIKMQTMDDNLAWRKSLILGQASWLSAKINLALRLTTKVKPMPQLKWLSNVAKTVSSALNWLWGKKETKEARKRQLSLSGGEKAATKNLHSWINTALSELENEGNKLTSTLCSRLLG